MDAIVIQDVTKDFKRRASRRDITSLKSEVVRLLRGKRQPDRKIFIEALRGVNLRVPQGKTMGIVGRNGSGKSTLLKLITGIYAPTQGTVQVNGRISALLDLGAGFHPDFTGRENILINGIILGMTRAEIRGRMDEIIAFSELGEFIDEPVRTYSSGMYMRLAFSVATHVDPDLLIIDEILAVGDEHFGRKSLAKMDEFKRSGKTIVLVTHDLSTLQRWCDLAAWIDGGKIRLVGEPRHVVREYREAVAIAEAQAAKTGSSALSTPGEALPALASVGSAPVTLTGARAVTAEGAQAEGLDPEDPLELQLDFTCKAPDAQVAFAVAILRADGTLMYSGNTAAEAVVLPSPLPEAGTVRLSLRRVGLTTGSYSVDIAVLDPGGTEYQRRPAACSFTVRSRVRESGVVRPAHEWSLEPRAEQIPPALSGLG